MLQESLAQLAAQLTSQGLPTVTDPRNLEVPGAVISATSIQFPYLDANTVEISCEVTALALPNGEELTTLMEYAKIMNRLSHTGVDLGTITLPNISPDPLPTATTEFTIRTSAEE